MSAVLDALAAGLLLVGVLLTLFAGVGLLRFPDALTRMHAQGKPAVLGLLLILAGAALGTRSTNLAATMLLVAAFQLVTAPVGTHAIGRAAYRVAQADRGLLVRDDLAGHLAQAPSPGAATSPGAAPAEGGPAGRAQDPEARQDPEAGQDRR